MTMGRRRKQEVKIIKKKLPEFYLCPKCGKNTTKVTVDHDKGRAAFRCSSCGLRSQMIVDPQTADVDAYCIFVDKYYGAGSGEVTKVG